MKHGDCILHSKHDPHTVRRKETNMTIASNIRPGDDPVEVSKKLVGQTRTQLMKELFTYFDIPANIIHHVFGNLYARNILTQRERELCAVAALCVLNRANELRSHIIAAIRTGATKAEVAEVILQMSTYGGMPVCLEGLEIARQVFEKSAATPPKTK
ncbi:MAG TPA: carboxymuconolactone decarboxylase family protein [Thermodesulfobacteriota bacterium]|nr:carboxymuconolactone decarboxylase family protein [Thermodesulfobacteriota bacterium]